MTGEPPADDAYERQASRLTAVEALFERFEALDDRLETPDDQVETLDEQPANETRTEQRLFVEATKDALQAPEIAKAINDYFSVDDVRAEIEQQREPIWALVATARNGVREAQEDLYRAEESVRQSLLDPEVEEAWQKRRAEMRDTFAEAERYVDEKKWAAQAPEYDVSVSKARALLTAAEASIAQEQAARGLVEATADDARDAGAAQGSERPAPGQVATTKRSRLRRRRLDDFEDKHETAQYDYQIALERLSKARRAIADFESADRRRRLVNEPAIERAISQDEACTVARQVLDAAKDLLRSDLYLDGTLPVASAFVNRRASKLYETKMEVPAASGLYDSLSQSTPFVTSAMERVNELLQRMRGASIGIGGPRGAGKTTLIEHFCPDGLGSEDLLPARSIESGWIRLRVSAPVEYVALDFILYLLSELCRAILRRSPDPTSSSAPNAAGGTDSAPTVPAIRRWIAPWTGIAALMGSLVFAEIALLGSPGLSRLCLAITAVSMTFLSFVFAHFPRSAGSTRRRPGVTELMEAMMPLFIGFDIATSYSLTQHAALRGSVVRNSLIWPQAAVGALLLLCGLTGWRLGTRGVAAAVRWPERSLMSASLLAAAGGAVALEFIVHVPYRPSLLLGGCMALAVGAAVSLIIDEVGRGTTLWERRSGRDRSDEIVDGAHVPGIREKDGPTFNIGADNVRFVLIVIRGVLVAGGLVAMALSSYHGKPNYGIVLGASLLAAGLVIVWWTAVLTYQQSRRIGFRSASESDPSPLSAQYRLRPPDGAGATAELTSSQSSLLATQISRDVDFLQTLSTDRSRTWSAGMTQLPVSFATASTTSASWARQPWNVPVAVHRFKLLADAAARDFGGVIIGIDELDKLGYDKAGGFLNDIKAIFGGRGSYFLVSVSENAAAGFERRGVPFRDVFDSSFDDIVTVGYMDWQTSRSLLNTRVVGMHAPFAALCYVFSGGLARDLIRTARAVLSYGDDAGRVLLSTAVRSLCLEEMQGKVRGICRELADLDDDNLAMSLLVYVQGVDKSFGTAKDYLDWSEYIGSWIGDVSNMPEVTAKSGQAMRYARELAAFGYFTATVHEFFNEQLSNIRFESAVAEIGPAGDIPTQHIERLAMSRQAMAVSPLVAERHIVDFREAWKWSHPRPVSGVLPSTQ
jgi:hypothetical protein